jgi:hypothetical protein
MATTEPSINLHAMKMLYNNSLYSIDQQIEKPAIQPSGILKKKYLIVEARDLKLPVFFPHFQVQGHNSITYISSPDLAVIENDKAAKHKLWQSLKKAFSI